MDVRRIDIGNGHESILSHDKNQAVMRAGATAEVVDY